MRFWVVQKQSTTEAILKAIDTGACTTEHQIEAIAAQMGDTVSWASPQVSSTEKECAMEKRCVNYVGLACVDGSCPAALDEFHSLEAADCENCFYYQGCADCALADTEHCEEVFYHGGKE